MDKIIGKRCRAFGLILIILGIVYSNSLDAGWHLDDVQNILKNPWIHIDDLYPESLINSFFAAFDKGEYRGQNVYRPAVMFSFAMNWYFGQSDVIGYHVVNIGIHVAAAFFLFLSIYHLLSTPNVRERYRNSRYAIALLSAVLWGIHPIQTQAVTYIVQRMASMAGMFFIAAIYTYLKARLVSERFKKAAFSAASLLLFVLAVLSKENAIMLPLVLISIEFIFFRDVARHQSRNAALVGVGLVCFILILGGTFFFLDNNLLAFLEQYNSRPFSLTERLMTEYRVVLYYLYQLFYPISSSYSVTHDFILSTSLFSPWTTLPAIILIIGSVAAALFYLQMTPILSFAVLFFFLNHLIESSIFPLELVFEHRNYIPSMFLFLPLAAGLSMLLDQYKTSGKKLLFSFYSIITTVLIIAVGIGTYTRNLDWFSEKSIWEDALAKAPGMARPHQNLAIAHYCRIGDYDPAIELLEKSLELKDSKPAYSQMISYLNLSQIYEKKKDIVSARLYAEKAVNAYSTNTAILNYISVLFQSDMPEKALQNSERFLKTKPKNEKALEYKTLSLLKLGQADAAGKAALQLIKIAPFRIKNMLYFGLAQSVLHHYRKAEYYLERVAGKRSPDQLFANLALIENSIKAGVEQKINIHVKQLFDRFSIRDIKQGLKAIQNEKYPLFKISVQGVEIRLDDYLKKMIDNGWSNADGTLEKHHSKA